MDFSIVVCTHNRAHQIETCLDSVALAVRRARDNLIDLTFEIVVVNNASVDETQSTVNIWIDNNPDVYTRLIFEEKKGIAYARNRSFEEANGKLLISIDDDCVMAENYVEIALNHYAKDNELVLRFGRLNPGDPEDWPMTIQTRSFVKRWRKGHPDYDYIHMGSICSANMMIPKEIIEKIGLYDTRFGTALIPGGEDADYGFRIYKSGFLIEYVPDAVVTHFHGRKTAEAVQKLIKGYSISSGALFAKYNIYHPHLWRKILPKTETHQQSNQIRERDPRAQQIGKFHKKAKIFYPLGFYRFFLMTIKQYWNEQKN